MVQKDVEAMADAALSMGTVRGNINKTRLMEDIDGMLGRYASVKSLSDMNIGTLMTELTSLLSNHNIAMPSEYTMLVRSLVTIEGVLEALCPELNLFDFLSKKMTERMKESFDAQEKVTELLQTLGTMGAQTTRMPGMVFDVLRNLVKGRMKINLELTGYEELLNSLNGTILNVVLALPREVPADQYPAMLQDFCREHFISQGMCVDFAIHDKGDGNPHAHIMLTMRAMDEHGKWLPKSRKVYDLDENGERIRLPSGNWKSHKEDNVDWNDQSKAEIWRHGWEVITNDYLEQNNRPERVDLRSFERQGVDLAPTIHLGPAVTQMEKRGIETDMGNLNREIKQVNRALLAIRKLIADLQSWIMELREKRNKLIEEKREPTLPELLTQYLDSRRDERSDWSVSGQRKGTTMDLKKVSHAVVYLQEHEIATVEDLQNHLNEKQTAFDSLDGQIHDKEKRMRDIQSQIKAWDSVEQLLPVHQEYIKIGWKSKREKFYQAHKAEIDEYNKAFRLRIKLYPDKKVPISSLRAELEKLTAEIADLKPEFESVKADLDELKTVRSIISPQEEKLREKEESKATVVQAPQDENRKIQHVFWFGVLCGLQSKDVLMYHQLL